MSIYLIRHGETDRNLHEIINPGDVDSELNKTGINQANEAGKQMKKQGLEFDVIISSPLIRAYKTAEIIAKHIGYDKKIITFDGLKEKFAGVFKDAYKKDFREQYSIQRLQELFEKYPNKHFEGLEHFDDFTKRITETMNTIVYHPDFSGKNILIVAHGGVLEVLTNRKHPGNCELIKYNHK